MSDSARTGPLDYDVNGTGNGWIRFVLPQPKKLSASDMRRLLRRVAGECGAWAVVVVVVLVVFAPVLGFAGAGGWALYTYAHSLATLWNSIKSYQLTDLAPPLHALDLAARVGVASAGYFALLASLIVLMAGLLGTRWTRLYLFPGMTFTLPSALAFFVGMTLSLNAAVAPGGISWLARAALLVYLLLDMIVLAAALVDVSPRKHRARRARWVRSERQPAPSAPLAPVHFGPSGPLTAYRADLAEALATMPAASSPEFAHADVEAGKHKKKRDDVEAGEHRSENTKPTLPTPRPAHAAKGTQAPRVRRRRRPTVAKNRPRHRVAVGR